jgi:hypothetical protein
MAKKDTYLALLRRGVDEVTAQTLADAGLTIGKLKDITESQLIGNYGLKDKIASSVIEVIKSGPSGSGSEKYLSKVLSAPKKINSDFADNRKITCRKSLSRRNESERQRLRLFVARNW